MALGSYCEQGLHYLHAMTSLDEPAQQDPNAQDTIAKSILSSGGKIPIGIDRETATRYVTNFLANQREQDDANKQSTAAPKQQTIIGHISGAGDRHVITPPATYFPKAKPTNENQGGGAITVQTGPVSGGYAGVVTGVNTITFDENYFQIQDNGGGEVFILLKTVTCP